MHTSSHMLELAPGDPIIKAYVGDLQRLKSQP